MQAKKVILELLSKDGLSYSSTSNLFYFIANTYHLDIEDVKRQFAKLEKDGDIFEIKPGKWVALPTNEYVKGTFIGNARGYGFCQIDNSDEEDIFIAGNSQNGAIDGDRVIVKVLSQTDEGSDGKVVKIIKPVTKLVGVVERVGGNLFVEPDNNHIPCKVKLLKGGLKAKEDDRVVVELSRKNENLGGVVIEVLGKSDDVKACELAIIRDHNLYETFTAEVLEEVKKLPMEVKDYQKKGRVDLTDKVTFTIDGEDAKDLDDAVSIERIENGYILGVHIADVGEYVKYDTLVDEEAFNRGTSVYFPTSVLPMLPKELSNGICSLNENVERLTLSCIMTLDEDANVVSHKICESVIKSRARLNYTNVYKVLCGEKADEKTESVKEELFLMHEISKKIQEKKKRDGSLDFEVPEVQFIFDENGMAVDFEKRERNDAHRLIEDFMVLANQTVAKEYCDNDLPFVYRVHESPRKEKTESVIEYMKGLGIKTPGIPEEITPKYYQSLIKLCENQPYTETVNKVILRSMQKARYTNQCLGHFGLALKYYCHFTSPIRRYPDLTIHRIIKENLHKGIHGARKEELDDFAFEAGEQSSLTEKNADKCEREVDDLWKAYLMRDRVGEEFEGVVSSVTNFGIFVELPNTVEGMIKVEDLPDSGFLLFEKQLKLKGQKLVFSVGDKVVVKLTASNIYTRKIDFEFVKFVK